MKAADVYAGSDGDLTKKYYAELEKRGPVGVVAMNLFRAQKCSTRAKVYRGGIRGRGSFRSMAYERKGWSMRLLCSCLDRHADELRIRYGWKQDPNTLFGERESWVLYVDLPAPLTSSGYRQVSFHSPDRGAGPAYEGEWDGVHMSEERILEFCDRVLKGALG